MRSQQLRRLISFVLLLGGAVFLVSCDGVADLNVENPNAPDRERAVTDPGDVEAILQGSFRSFWQGVYESQALGIGTQSYAPGPHLDMMGEATTTTNAVSDFVGYSAKPMGQLQNSSGYSGLGAMKVPWENLNGAMSSANDVIFAIEEDGLDIVVDGSDRTTRTRAAAYLVRGLAHGYVANIFDQGYLQTLDFPQNQNQPEVSDYGAVLDQAISDLQQARSIAEGSSFELAGVLPWAGSPPNAEQVAQIANTMSARFVVQNSRTLDENTGSTIGGSEQYGWNDVLQWTRNGIEEDISLQLSTDPYEDDYAALSTLINWYFRVDHRIINLMDSDYPARYPPEKAANGEAIPPAESEDERLCDSPRTEGTGGFGDIVGADREPDNCFYFYVDNFDIGFDSGRDASSFSTYWWAPQWATTIGNEVPYAGGPRPLFLENENRTLQAEAEIRASNGGGVSAARELVNNGSRTNIGGLDPLSTSDQNEVLKAIYYERAVQLARTVPALAWADLRRRDALFAGTPTHLPLPAGELETVRRDVYSFGGPQNTGNPGTSSGDMAWCTGDNPLVGNTVPSSGCDPSGYTAPSPSSEDAERTISTDGSGVPASTPVQ